MMRSGLKYGSYMYARYSAQLIRVARKMTAERRNEILRPSVRDINGVATAITAAALIGGKGIVGIEKEEGKMADGED
jgi:hypothetical protein